MSNHGTLHFGPISVCQCFCGLCLGDTRCAVATSAIQGISGGGGVASPWHRAHDAPARCARRPRQASDSEELSADLCKLEQRAESTSCQRRRSSPCRQRPRCLRTLVILSSSPSSTHLTLRRSVCIGDAVCIFCQMLQRFDVTLADTAEAHSGRYLSCRSHQSRCSRCRIYWRSHDAFIEGSELDESIINSSGKEKCGVQTVSQFLGLLTDQVSHQRPMDQWSRASAHQK